MTAGHITAQPDAQAIAWLGGSVHHVLVDAEASDGRLSIFRSEMLQGTASPVHVHDVEDETVYVLSGSAVFWVGPDRWVAGPGDTVFMPRHVPHSYLITADRAEIITVCNPGGMESFFRAVGWDLAQPLPDGWQVDMTALAAAGHATGQHVLGPPLGADDVMPAEFLSTGDS